jgi:hypothetical protein
MIDDIELFFLKEIKIDSRICVEVGDQRIDQSGCKVTREYPCVRVGRFERKVRSFKYYAEIEYWGGDVSLPENKRLAVIDAMNDRWERDHQRTSFCIPIPILETEQQHVYIDPETTCCAARYPDLATAISVANQLAKIAFD